MGNNCKTIVYITTNIKNNKIYIGIHDTDNPEKFDGYLGCGVDINHPSSISHPKTPFQYAVKKYGFNSFIRATISICDTREDALQIERLLVNHEFIKREDTYNIELGGGDPPKGDSPAYQYSITGEFIAEYKSLREAAKSVGVSGGINIAINYKTICGGFLWSNEKVDKLDLTNYKIVVQKTPIYIYNKDGEFISVYNSISEFCKKYKVSLGSVQRAIITKTKVRGFYISKIKLPKFEKLKTEKVVNKIYQYTLSGKFISEWNSCNEIQKHLGKKYSRIIFCLKNGNPVCGEYQWSYIKFLELPNKEKKSLKRRVGQFDMHGNFIKSFETVRECRKEFGNVSRVLSGKCTHCKGFIFKYLDS